MWEPCAQKSDSKNYWIDYYINGKRTRERIIGRSKQAAENRLREVETAKAEGNHIKKNKSSMISLGETPSIRVILINEPMTLNAS